MGKYEKNQKYRKEWESTGWAKGKLVRRDIILLLKILYISKLNQFHLPIVSFHITLKYECEPFI